MSASLSSPPLTSPATETREARAAEISWATPREEVADRPGLDPASGLTEAEGRARRERFGPNVLAEPSRRGPLAILADQFRSLVVALLVVATMAIAGRP